MKDRPRRRRPTEGELAILTAGGTHLLAHIRRLLAPRACHVGGGKTCAAGAILLAGLLALGGCWGMLGASGETPEAPGSPAAQADGSTDDPAASAAKAGGGEPWLKLRVTERDLGKIAVSRCAFVFPKDVEIRDTASHAMKDGYMFVAEEMLYITDRVGKLVVKHKLPDSNVRGRILRGDGWFGYSDASAGWSAARLRVFHTNGKEIGNVAVPNMCRSYVSRDASRVFFLQVMDADANRLRGPIVADVRTGKVLREHQLSFGGLMLRGYIAPTRDGLIAALISSGEMVCFDSNGEITSRSSLSRFGRAPASGGYVLGVDRKAVPPLLKVLDTKGQTVLEKSLSSIGYVRVLPDGKRLLLTCIEKNQQVWQLYSLKDGSRLWSAPHPADHAHDFNYACLSPDGSRLASFSYRRYSKGRVIDKDSRVAFTIAVLDLATGAELLSQELPFREKTAYFRQPRWADAKTIELIPADYLYRIRLKF